MCFKGLWPVQVYVHELLVLFNALCVMYLMKDLIKGHPKLKKATREKDSVQSVVDMSC